MKKTIGRLLTFSFLVIPLQAVPTFQPEPRHEVVGADLFEGLNVIPLGTKVSIIADNRPGSPAIGQEGVVFAYLREDWLLVDLNDPNNPIKRAPGVLPAGYQEWNPENEDDPPGGKFAVLFGLNVYRLLDGTVVADNEVRVNPTEPIEAQLEAAIRNKVEQMTKVLEKVETAVLRNSLPEPNLPDVLAENLSSAGAVYSWPLTDLDGQPINLAAAKGKILYINLWATWCHPCRWEMPNLEKLYTALKDEAVFAFISNEDGKTVTDFLNDNPYSLPIYISAESAMPELFKTDDIPAVFIITPDGKVAYEKIGAIRWNIEKTRTFFQLLKK